MEITVAEHGIILNKKGRTKKEILFSELDQIYITVNKMKTSNKLLIILLLLFFGLFSYFYLQVDIPIILAYLVVILLILKTNKFRRYTLKIRLKNGKTFKKEVQLKSKQETIDIVTEVRKEIYNSKIKKSNEALISVS